MTDTALHALSVLFAIVGGTGAGVLALLSWGVLRESPFGTVVALLSITLSGMIAYHAILFVLEPDSLFLDTLRSALQTVVAIFLWLVIATHQHIEHSATGG
ncbi:hypothetical protein [Halomontanus rarus]|uniref:hypothetical protein n=1 Tax=Halomontanus rarus TaxID=3034020 RepID=UPI0023E8A52D|nr:hypothetical protein [Halovivax sp. TS33]